MCELRLMLVIFWCFGRRDYREFVDFALNLSGLGLILMVLNS